ncbi:M28 family peptidase [Methylocaldum sp.]|uniref:M28 family peptidase n=1 Tax=Methylocaldum sp. TaxID=1969727 RepID=UPI002D426709|nr:M28 family peptidase [Methylocaldum sp.]HYE37258.1 M28 family peptidase [Methylocaldum sp.]
MTYSEETLKEDVAILAGDIGERNLYRYESLQAAIDFIEARFRACGWTPQRQTYEARGKAFANIEVEMPGLGQPAEIVVVGSHYDTVRGSPGANDNGSAVAALFALAAAFAKRPIARTLRFVAFVNEERPFLRTSKMGSRVYAKRSRERGERILGMLSLETLGYCSEVKGSQKLSLGGWLLPQRGDFIAVVANRASRPLLAIVEQALPEQTSLTCRGLVLPTHFPGAWSSDHWSFWKEGYPALMVTDTAPLRYPYYHKPEDTPDKVNYRWLYRVVKGIESAVAKLVG